MKKTFRKIATVASGALMIGASVGMAAAAAYPAPFVESGVADVAVVYGADAAISDINGAAKISSDLSGDVVATSAGGATTVTGGDSVKLERSSDKLNLGDSASDVFVTSIDADDMPNLLADGTYMDDENTEYETTQKIALKNNLNISHFEDSDYADGEPTIGIKIPDDKAVINYTLDFVTHPLFNASQMETTTLDLMGKQYYVLDVVNSSTPTSNKLTLLDSANTAIVTEGETVTVSGSDVAISFISGSEVKLTIDGETTNSLAEGATYKLSDGTYVGVKDILYSQKDTGISKVEISLGSGKLELTHANNVVMNDDTVQEMIAYLELDSSSKLDKIKIGWTTDDEAFITADSSLTMPAFGAVKFSMGGLFTMSEEETVVEASGSDVIELKTTIEDGSVTIPLLKSDTNGKFELIGKDSSNRLVTSPNTNLFVNETAGDKYIVASWNSTTEGESYYLKVEIITEDNVNKTRFTNVVTGDEKKVTEGSEATFGSVILTVNDSHRDGSQKWTNLTINAGGSFHELYTAEGLKTYLPYYSRTLTDSAEGALNYTGNTALHPVQASHIEYGHYNGTILGTTGYGNTSIYMFFREEDKDENLARGKLFNFTLTESGTSNKVHVGTVNVNGSSGYEIEDTDDYEYYVASDLATKVVHSTGGDQDPVTITYHGEQAYVELYVSDESATVVGDDTEAGVVTVTDAEVDTVSSKNLVVVGGSAINSVAAELLGGAYRGAEFASMTGVEAGEYLVEVMASPYTSGKVAMLVAGYNAEDTEKAVTYVTNNDVDTTVGTKLEGTSATEATVVTA